MTRDPCTRVQHTCMGAVLDYITLSGALVLTSGSVAGPLQRGELSKSYLDIASTYLQVHTYACTLRK